MSERERRRTRASRPLHESLQPAGRRSPAAPVHPSRPGPDPSIFTLMLGKPSLEEQAVIADTLQRPSSRMSARERVGEGLVWRRLRLPPSP